MRQHGGGRGHAFINRDKQLSWLKNTGGFNQGKGRKASQKLQKSWQTGNKQRCFCLVSTTMEKRGAPGTGDNVGGVEGKEVMVSFRSNNKKGCSGRKNCTLAESGTVETLEIQKTSWKKYKTLGAQVKRGEPPSSSGIMPFKGGRVRSLLTAGTQELGSRWGRRDKS